MDDQQASSTDSLLQNAPSWKLDQWTEECALLPKAELSLLVPYASPEFDNQNWKEKLEQLFIHLPDSHIESFGKALNSMQFHEIVRFAGSHQKDSANRKKLTSLFVGISPLVFSDLLSHASQEELSFLREEAVTEPVQHHLSLITTELDQRFNEFCNQISLKTEKVDAIDLQKLGNKELSELYECFEKFNKEGRKILNLTSRALAIAWNANRADLIQELGRIKELCQKCMNDLIGKEGTQETPSSGLYHTLDKKVSELFSDQDSQGNLTLMKDSTPALEALVKFSVWYIQDYAEVGLLPEISMSHAADPDRQEEDLKSREQMFIMAENNLRQIGLSTLSDLKNARIYSKKALKEYISSAQRS